MPVAAPQRGPSWSPDGNWIAYYSLRDGKPAVLKARVGWSAPPELVSWSPRGDWIAFDHDGKLRIVSPDGKQDRIVSRRQWETYGWSKDGASIYGIALDQNRRLMLGRIDIATAKETKLSDLGPAPSAAFDIGLSYGQFPFRGFSLHPNGKSFLTSIFRMKSQIYLMEGFDRPVRLIDRLWRWYYNILISLRATTILVGRAPWPAADPLVGLLGRRKSRTRGSGADEGVRPTFGCGYAELVGQVPDLPRPAFSGSSRPRPAAEPFSHRLRAQPAVSSYGCALLPREW